MNRYLVIFLLSLWHELLAKEHYSIQRRVLGNVLPDWFVLPPSMCSASNVSVQCTSRGGKHVGGSNGSTCECDEDKSTFGLYYNSWKCIENTKFHDKFDCSLRLDDRSTSSPIITITREYPPVTYRLSKLNSLTDYVVTIEGSSLSCNGTWRKLNDRLVKGTFVVWKENKNWFLSTKRYLDHIEGQIIRLNIKCLSDQYCVILKVEGTLRCPLPPTPSQPATTVSGMSSTRQLRRRPPSSPITIATNTGTSTTKSFETRKTTYSSVKKRKKSDSEERDKSGLIAGAVAGIIGLAIIVIAIMVIIKRRKKRNSDEQRTGTVDNAGYGRGQDNSLRFNSQQSPDADEYSYAYNNPALFIKSDRQNLQLHSSNKQEPGSSAADQVYSQTEELNQKASTPSSEAPVYSTLEGAVYAKVDKSRKEYPSNSDAPIYNTIEEPEYAKVDKNQKTKLSAENHDEPLYNVLEGPEIDDSALEGRSDEPPCYQVLEGPFSEGAPVYDVLEGPESDEAPVYGAIEGQYIQVSPEKNIGYNDMLYDSVGDVINDQPDIYQQLDQKGQRNSNVYQALS